MHVLWHTHQSFLSLSRGKQESFPFYNGDNRETLSPNQVSRLSVEEFHTSIHLCEDYYEAFSKVFILHTYGYTKTFAKNFIPQCLQYQ